MEKVGKLGKYDSPDVFRKPGSGKRGESKFLEPSQPIFRKVGKARTDEATGLRKHRISVMFGDVFLMNLLEFVSVLEFARVCLNVYGCV